MKAPSKSLAFFGILFTVVLVYIGYNYYVTEKEAERKANSEFNFAVDPERVREIGYVLDLRTTRHWMDHKKEIIWWIKIPATDKIYSCSWEAGFPNYHKDEGVILIHIPDGGPDGDDWDGCIIGLHGKHQGKKTLVWALDVDDLDLD